MSHSSLRRHLFWFALMLAHADAHAAAADMLSAVQVLREGGCGGTVPAAKLLHHSALLDRAAERLAAGQSPAAAAEFVGYDAERTAGVHVKGPDRAAVELLERSGCRALTNPSMRDIGVYRRGTDAWLLLAAGYVAPSRTDAAAVAARTLELVNAIRMRGSRCGARSFAPAPAVRLSAPLAEAAFGHAQDMAQHGYFEHEDRFGHTPADRVRATGYQEKLVGENIAYGPKSAEEVVQGWLESPGHCENLLDPRFAEMGIAYVPGRGAKHGLYWVQLLVDPKI
jgi:uncharacterized protein YkwD